MSTDTSIYDQGFAAFWDGISEDQNPYKRGTRLQSESWKLGWEDAGYSYREDQREADDSYWDQNYDYDYGDAIY